MRAGRKFFSVLGRWRWPLLGLALSFLHLSARADLWAYVDEQGTAHFAATQVDARYSLFYKGGDVARLDLGNLKPAAPEQPATPLPRRFAELDASRGYQAVQKHLRAAASKHRVDYELLKAVVAADAAGRTDRQGRSIPARSIEQKLTDPRTNIDAGARSLADLIRLFKGELELALAAYNAGEGAVQRAGNRIPNFRETQGYVKTVMGLYGAFKPAPARPAAAATFGARANGRVRVELAPGHPLVSPGGD